MGDNSSLTICPSPTNVLRIFALIYSFPKETEEKKRRKEK
jgi:hypothetical protein